MTGMGLPWWTPTTEHTLAQCQNEACGTDVWIGPKQKAVVDAYPGHTVKLCMACGLLEQQRRGGGVVGHLGGGGGTPRT
ncbi:hypothetical protein ACQEVC_34040 [Plantactinospora sp. CA-294935]|uniref:hypothetical protein n=1 Tax=Plantactinospora sp. CA-294935 TaxID=3240012 RepID=UPI003D946765